MLLLFNRKKKEEDDLLKEIRKCTESVKKSSVEQTATMRAWSAQNNLDVDKFRQEVESELKANAGTDEQKGS